MAQPWPSPTLVGEERPCTPATGHGRPNALPHPEPYVGQRLLVLEQQEPVALLRAGILQDQGKVLDMPQGQAVLQRHHHVLQMPQTGSGGRHWLPPGVGAGTPRTAPFSLALGPCQHRMRPCSAERGCGMVPSHCWTK